MKHLRYVEFLMNFLKATRNYFSPRLWPRLKFDNTNPRTQNLIQEMKASHPQLTINSDQPDPKKKESSFLHFIFWWHLASLFIIIKGVMGLESVGEGPLATLSDLFVAGLNVLSFIPPMSLYKPHKSLKKMLCVKCLQSRVYWEIKVKAFMNSCVY